MVIRSRRLCVLIGSLLRTTMKSEVGTSLCRKQSLIEDARKEKEVSEISASEPAVTCDPPDEGSSTLNLMFTIRNASASSLSSSLKILEMSWISSVMLLRLRPRALRAPEVHSVRTGLLPKHGTIMYHIETRPAGRCKKKGEELECFVKCFIHNSSICSLLSSLKKVAADVKIVKELTGFNKKKADMFMGLSALSFPRKVQDLDMCQNLNVKFEPNFDKDHPGFGDKEYKKRRAYFAELAFKYKDGNVIPRIEYSTEEIATWRQVYKSLSSLYPNYACKQYLDTFHQLEEYCGYTENSIPQLQDISIFLKERTGFKLRPAAGLLSARDFLACLAFRVFPSTQYLRHPSAVMHSPEPDCCHELLGHIPMLADKDFAQFSQDIGLASLGASDEDIEKLSTLYWFTIEFGLCKQNGSIKAYGAGLLSSYGELSYALSNKPELKPFDPEVTAIQSYQDNSFQPVYFVSESFEDSKAKLRQYAVKMKRPFYLRYDPFTCSVEILDSFQKVRTALCQIKDELTSLCSALDRMY